MAFCMNCGKEFSDEEEYCPYCGVKKGEVGLAGRSTYPANNIGSAWEDRRPAPEYKPISMWGYVGYDILFCIPIAGFILVIILAIVPKNQNVKNFARSWLLWLLIVVLLVIVMVHVGVFAGLKAYMDSI